MLQNGLTIIVPIAPGREDSLRALLNEIGTHIDTNPHIPFYEFSTVHFMRWVILPAVNYGKYPGRPTLVLSTNFDGSPKAHLHELVKLALPGLKLIYSHCEGCKDSFGKEEMQAFLHRHIRKNAAFYTGTLGRTVSQIHQERRLRYGIQQILQEMDPSQKWAGGSAKRWKQQIEEKILQKSGFQWLKEKYRSPFLYRNGRVVLALGLGLLLALVTALLFIWPLPTAYVVAGLLLMPVIWFITLRIKENTDARNFQPAPRDAERLAQLNEREDFRIQNQISHLVTIKPGLFRQGTIRFVLWAINLLARTFYNRGNLGGIPSIHFARWAIVDGNRLLFFSNFDGSWESYLGDFIDKAAIGLTGVWSNTEGFPPTRKLIYAGARNSENFKAWVRQKQIETQVWYSAYKTSSVENVNNNTAIREGILKEMEEIQSAAWLQKL